MEDLFYLLFNTDFGHYTVSFREKAQMLWILQNCATIHDHPRPAINLQPPPTTKPLPTIIKPLPPTKNDSLPTTLLTIKNFELYFSHHYYLPRRIQEQFKFIRQYPPSTNKKIFSGCRNSFYSQFTHY